MIQSQQRLLFVGDSGVADGVAAVVDADLSVTSSGDMEVRAALDAGQFDGVLVDGGVAGATGLVSKIAKDDRAPDALFVTADRQGVDDALDVGAVDYVRADDPPRIIRRRVQDLATKRAGRDRERERYRTLVQTAGDAMYALDEEGTITMVNESYVEVTDKSREELIGSDPEEHISDEAVAKAKSLIREILDDDDRNRGRVAFEMTDANGEPRQYEDNIAVLTDEEGNFMGSVGVLRDISDRKRRTEALRRQNERLDEFASVVSHDLRNPLNVVQGHIDLVRETDEEMHLDVIEEEIAKLGDLLDELLELARKGKVVSDPETVSLVEVARAAWEGVPTDDATLELPDGDPTVDADETRLRELFGNLFWNSFEHAGPDVTVRVGTTEDGFYVADDGPGISETDRERVFDRGYTTADDGTGLGLGIVKRIADGHGWSVSVTASEDVGEDNHARLLRGTGDETERSTSLRDTSGRGGARFEFRTTVSRR
jgi:PAS domain S-box-containing protein